MGFLFTSQKKNEKLVAIFDIGSGSVGGAIVSIPINNTEEIPTIIKSIRKDIKIREHFDFDIFMNDMNMALHYTADSLLNQKRGAPEEIFCVLSSPWYLSETRIVKIAKNNPFIFTEKIANELINKEILILRQSYKNKYGNTENTPEMIEHHTTDILLDGYMIEDPIGKQCKSAEMNMIMSLTPLLCIDKIRETLSKTFHHINVNFSSFMVSTYLAVRDRYVNDHSYLLIDISGEITDIGIVTDGVLKSVLSFPFGKKTFYNNICSKLKIELRDAKELFKLHNEGNMSSLFSKKVEPVFNSIENSWLQSFNQSIATLSPQFILPNTIFLTADNDIKNWFTKILQKKSNFVVSLDGSEFLNMCNVLEGESDPFLMIEAMALTRKINCSYKKDK